MVELELIQKTDAHPNPKRERGGTGYQLHPRSRFGLGCGSLASIILTLLLLSLIHI